MLPDNFWRNKVAEEYLRTRATLVFQEDKDLLEYIAKIEIKRVEYLENEYGITEFCKFCNKCKVFYREGRITALSKKFSKTP